MWLIKWTCIKIKNLSWANTVSFCSFSSVAWYKNELHHWWFTNLGEKAGNVSLLFSNFTKIEHIVKWFARSSKYPENNRGWALLKSRELNFCISAQYQAIILLFGQIKTEHIAPYLHQQLISHSLFLCTHWMFWGEHLAWRHWEKLLEYSVCLKLFLTWYNI